MGLGLKSMRAPLVAVSLIVAGCLLAVFAGLATASTPPSCSSPLLGGNLQAGSSLTAVVKCSGDPSPSLSYQWQVQPTVQSLSVGYAHRCASLAGGTVRCWGNNYSGQLGDGTTSDRATPVTVSGISDAVAVGAGGFHSCAALSTGSVKCWGYNHAGQLGNGTTTSSSVPVTVSGISNAVKVAAGGYNTCALLSDSTVRCWGYNYYGQLGDGTTTSRSSPVAVSGLSGVSGISVSSDYACAALSSGGVRCWGSNYEGQMGNGGGANTYLTPVAVSGITTAAEVSVGGYVACARLLSGGVRCWGANFSGQLGDGTTTDSSTPVAVSGVSAAVEIEAGNSSACARFSVGSLKCWGSNAYGDLGDGSSSSFSSTPVTVSGISSAVLLSSNSENRCALLTDKSLKCWGNSANSLMADNSQSYPEVINTPATVSLSRISSWGSLGVASSSNTLALTSAQNGHLVKVLISASNGALPDVSSSSSASCSAVGDAGDCTAPIAMWSSPSSPRGVAAVNFGLVFTESVSGLSSSSFTNDGSSTGCSFAVSASSGVSFTVTASGCSEGTISPRVLIGPGGAGLGPVGSGSSADPVTVDGTPPSASWGSLNSATGGSAPSFYLDLTEPLSSLSASSIINSGTAQRCRFTAQAVSSLVWRITPWGCTSGTVRPRLMAGGMVDAVGNAGPAAPVQASAFTLDTTPPRFTSWTSPSQPARISLPYTVSFSEAIEGLSGSDFNVSGSSGCQVTPQDSQGQSVQVSVSSCSSSGKVTLRLKPGSVTDAAGNSLAGSAPSSGVGVMDVTSPVAAVVSLSPGKAGQPVVFGVRFSEPVSGLEASDFRVLSSSTGCSLSLASTTSRGAEVRLSGCSAGRVRLFLAPNSVADDVGNSGPVKEMSSGYVVVAP